MALPMPRPFEHKNGTYYLNVRLPAGLPPVARGARVPLPIGSATIVTTITDKVFCSLRTKDPSVAKERFSNAFIALSKYFEALKAGPRTLSHKEVVALAGEVYRRRADEYDANVDFVPDGVGAAMTDFGKAVDAILPSVQRDDGFERGEAVYLAAAALPGGPQVLAWRLGQDIDYLGVSMTLDQALEDMFGRRADEICATNGIVIDAPSRRRLLEQIGVATSLLTEKLKQNASGDYSPDPNLSRFPPFVPPAKPRTAPSGRHTVASVFEIWKAKLADNRSASTMRRYGPSLSSLNSFTKGRDIRLITQDDILEWAKHRRDVDKISTSTVNGNDLVAAASMFSFAQTSDGGRLLTDNPAKGVKLPRVKRQKVRERTFRHAEIRAILLAARGVKPAPRYPKAALSRRWTPWICAYSGSRIQEVLWLERKDVWCEAGIWVMRFRETKTDDPRTVVIHSELEREGFIEFVRGAPEGFLFVGDGQTKTDATRSAQEMRAAELASWIKRTVALEDGVSPNHSWRHTFISKAENKISPRYLSAITGHSMRRTSSDKYFHPDIAEMKVEIEKFPPFQI